MRIRKNLLIGCQNRKIVQSCCCGDDSIGGVRMELFRKRVGFLHNIKIDVDELPLV